MKKILILATFLLSGLMACQSQSPDKPGLNKEQSATASVYEDLDVAGFKAKMAEPGIVLLDVRTPEEIAKGKIEGAEELNFYDENFTEALGKLDKEKTYLVYCRSGNRSGKACKMMQEQGFKKMYNLKGGFIAWSQQ